MDKRKSAQGQAHAQQKISINFWCGMINNSLIGVYVLSQKIKIVAYLKFLQSISLGLLENVDLRGILFHHDRALPHFGIDNKKHLDYQAFGLAQWAA